jgi:response regulator
VKPFEIEEILARLRALFRRLQMEEQSRVVKQTRVEYRDLVVEVENRVVRRAGEVIDLTKKEYELLLLLMENIDIVLSREVLLKEVWGYKNEVETNVIDVYVRYIRNKIDVPGRESYIQTVRGTGYVMRS